MKATELMVGDWVNYKGIYNTVARADFDIHHDKWIEEIQPIPITEEILEKNGFIKDAGEDDREISKYHLFVPTGIERISFTIQVNLYKEPICGVSTLVKCWGQTPPYNGGLNDIHLCSANYVHELQHALRLCGITLNIEV